MSLGGYGTFVYLQSISEHLKRSECFFSVCENAELVLLVSFIWNKVKQKRKTQRTTKQEGTEYNNSQKGKGELGRSTHVRRFPELYLSYKSILEFIGSRTGGNLQSWQPMLWFHLGWSRKVRSKCFTWKSRHNMLPFSDRSRVKEESLLKILFIWFCS